MLTHVAWLQLYNPTTNMDGEEFQPFSHYKALINGKIGHKKPF